MAAARVLLGHQPHLLVLRIGAGLAVGLWGVSKLEFASDWMEPYQTFYTGVPVALVVVYVLGIVQLSLGAAIALEFYRRPAAWIAVAISLVNLAASLATFVQTGLPLPAPLGLKVIWFFFNPIALTIVLVALALMPSSRNGARG